MDNGARVNKNACGPGSRDAPAASGSLDGLSMPTEEIVTRAEDLAACCKHLADCPVVGFDTEFIGEQTFVPQLCLIQVATPERLTLIDPLSAGPLDPFWE